MRAKYFTEQLVGWRMAGAALLMSATMAVGANAQQTTNTTGTTTRTILCPTARVSGPSTSAGVSGATYGTAAATTATTTTTTPAANGTPTDAGSTAGVPAATAPNNTSTNPDKRLTGLNATNGANGVGADTTTTGKHTATAAGSLPADSAAACAAATKDHS